MSILDLDIPADISPARVGRMIRDHDLAERARIAAINAERARDELAAQIASRATRLDRLDADLGDWRARMDAGLRRAS